jgi:hypothetical protein
MFPSFGQQVEEFVGHQFRGLGHTRASHLSELTLKPLLSDKNPYLTRVKFRNSVADVVGSLLEGATASLDESLFVELMEALAVFVSNQTCGGRKSGLPGIDIDLEREGVRYLIAVKSGKNWSNSSSMKKLKDNFQTAVRVLKQNKGVGDLQPTIGICYGSTKRLNNGAYLQVCGQDFWELISGEPDLYMDIIEPIGYKAQEFNDEFVDKRDRALNRMVREFTEQFCMADGKIDWQKIVTHVSKTS